jgi:hypothetical protein
MKGNGLLGYIMLILGVSIIIFLIANAVVKSYFRTKLKFWKEWGKSINGEEKNNEQKVG